MESHFPNRVPGTFNYLDDQFHELGLHRTNEPMRVTCERCGAEIDPWKAFAHPPDAWWRCPRGCNGPSH